MAVAAGLTAMGIMTGGCTGRTADNMTPSGETVRVVIPTPDIAADSALATGDVE